jgi:lipopolysaccharide assembly outer membrane protein LptD (OstA)
MTEYKPRSKFLYGFCIFVFLIQLTLGFLLFLYAQDDKRAEDPNAIEPASAQKSETPPSKGASRTPITVNGDRIEYSADSKVVTASGNIEVEYKGSKLTCQKLTINTETKVGQAEGDARLDDQQGTIEGERIIYNFETKAGTIIDANFRSNPYFGRAKKIEKVSDKEFIVLNGYATTCSFDQPHYRIKSKSINVFPKDKIQTKENAFFIGDIPVLYLPQYSHSLKEPFMHVRFVPGKSNDWGPYLLTAWRYNLMQNLNGRVYLDMRKKLGLAEGFGLNYTTDNFGRGDYKFYYTKEKPDNLPSAVPHEFDRYLMRWRHKYNIDERTNFISEIYKIYDEKRKKYDANSNMLKDYFYREYEKDSQPLSYALLHHSFTNSSLDLLVQKRINRWYDSIDKLPELKYTLPNLKIGQTLIYYENDSSFANLSKKATTSPVTPNEEDVTRLDTTHKFSLPVKVAFLGLTPFVADRQTFYDKGDNDKSLPIRTIFYSGLDLSTRFYRIFEVKSNFLGMDIDGLRHIITPTIEYAYNHQPTIQSEKLKQIDSVDSIEQSNVMSLGLSNKLQTKRKGQSVDLLDARISTDYVFKPKSDIRHGSHLSDLFFELELLPSSWMRIDLDTTYKHSGSPSDPNYNHFSNTNYDINFDFGKARSLGFGQRYQRKGGNEMISNFSWRLNPKWKFSIYNRYEQGDDPALKRGLKEIEFTVSRDLHCWQMDITFNRKKDEGSTIWFIFRLKAFPEAEFGFNQSYHKPKSGSGSNQ